MLYCGSPWTAGGQLPQHGLSSTGISALTSGSPSPLLHWPWCQCQLGCLFLSHILIPLCGMLLVLHRSTPPLKYILTEVLSLPLMDSFLATGVSILELLGIGTLGHRGSFQQLLTEDMAKIPHLSPNIAMPTKYIHGPQLVLGASFVWNYFLSVEQLCTTEVFYLEM